MTLLRAIEQTFCSLKSPTQEELKQALQAIEHQLSAASDYKTEPTQFPYGRNVIYQTPELEVIVIHIPSASATAIHNHGTSVGAAYVAAGTIINSKFQLDAYGYPTLESDDVLQEGDYFIAPRGQIHQMTNPFHTSAVSLHVYSPPLSSVTRYLPYTEVLDYVI
ncbi:cysteine dioxygenase [Paenibacillus whitsoniae]|uniref:Cysteine dioxygenase n=1 Tax=Paenibacillus whitsoniae TaxID=2496558 RepID=A0A430JH50_9BACL|nr:cysteine dioxygenase family protein [Paenibacillus whitsoniae]RTE10391.1 cysteine dioxygenase [Paenibacillus whitsoniae]